MNREILRAGHRLDSSKLASAASLALMVGLAVSFLGCDTPRSASPQGDAASSVASAHPSAPTATASSASPPPSASATPAGTREAASPTSRRPRPLSVKEPDATTSPAIALANFEAQFPEHERLLQARPDALELLSAAAGAHLDRVTYLGQMDSIDRALALAERAVKAHPREPKALLLRASARSMIHEFEAAAADVDAAAKLGAEPYVIAAKRGVLAMALGKYDEAEPLLASEAKRFPNLTTLGLHAVCLGHMGRHDESERQFEAAEATFRDVSPFALAWLYFQRAEMWDRAGKPERARDLYTIVVERLPFFARGAIHLSELIPAAEGKPYLDAVATTADDPEVSSALFHATEALAPGSGKAYLEKAAARYEVLMARYPKAFADHAAEFHLGVTKDAKKALAATTLNLANRKTAQAYVLHLEALAASSETKAACATADEAGKLRYPTGELEERRAEAYRACGKKGDATPR